MNVDYLRSLKIAAAELESAEYQRDQAASHLQAAVIDAVSNGGSVAAVARAAELPPETVFTMCDHAGSDATGLLVI